MDTTSMTTAHDGHIVIDLPAQVIHISRDDLEAIVQAAYDEHGILARPSYYTEATTPKALPFDRPGADVLGMIQEHVNAAHAAYADRPYQPYGVVVGSVPA